jgi:hypothetical protein
LQQVTGSKAVTTEGFGLQATEAPELETPRKKAPAPPGTGLKQFAIIAGVVVLSALGYFAILNYFLPPEQRVVGGLTQTERNMFKKDIISIQVNLCVVRTGEFDAATRAAIQQAKLGGNRSSISVVLFGNSTDQIVSAAEVQIFLGSEACNVDRSGTDRGYRTAFEKFAFPDEAGIRALQSFLAFCDPNLAGKRTGKFDELTRSAIQIAKVKLSGALKSNLTDPETDTLNAESYDSIARTCR